MQRVLVSGVIALFTLAGLVLLVTGDAGERLGGAMAVLFFGVGGSAYVAMPLMTRRGSATVLSTRVPTGDGPEPAFLFPVPRAKRLVGVTAAAGLTAGSVLLAVAGNPLAGWTGAAVFGAFAAIMLRTLGKPRGVALTPARVQVMLAEGTHEAPWETIQGAEIFDQPASRGTTIPTLGIAADDGAVRTIRGWAWMARLNRGFTGHALTIGADHLAGSAEDVARAVRRYRADPVRRAAIGTPEERARLVAELR